MPVSLSVLGHARARPDALAASIGEGRASFGELARRAAQVAAGLGALPPSPRRSVGLPPRGRLLALALGNGIPFVELFVGGTAGGNACAVLDPGAPTQASEALSRLMPDLLVADRAGASFAAAARRHGIPLVTLDPGDADALPYADWISGHADADPERWLAPGDDETPFLVGFTSGTTSTPKAFLRSRASWKTSLAAGRTVFGLTDSTHTLAPGPLVHGLTLYALAESLDAGCAFHGLPKFGGGAFVEALAREDVRRLVVVPTMLAALCDAAGPSGAVFPGVRSVVTAGSKIDDRLVAAARAALPAAELVEYYGASELGFVTVAKRVPGSSGRDVGHPFPGVEVAIRAAPGGSAESPGKIVVRSPLVCSGYVWGEDGRGFATDGPWATVGDVGWLDAEGALHLVGREGGMVITGGLNVYPSEVEDVLRRIDGVEDAVVLGMPDEYLGRRLVAVLRGPGAGRMDHAGLAAFCERSLSRAKIPRLFLVAERLPITSSGKVARGQLEDWIANGSKHLTVLSPPR